MNCLDNLFLGHNIGFRLLLENVFLLLIIIIIKKFTLLITN